MRIASEPTKTRQKIWHTNYRTIACALESGNEISRPRYKAVSVKLPLFVFDSGYALSRGRICGGAWWPPPRGHIAPASRWCYGRDSHVHDGVGNYWYDDNAVGMGVLAWLPQTAVTLNPNLMSLIRSEASRGEPEFAWKSTSRPMAGGMYCHRVWVLWKGSIVMEMCLWISWEKCFHFKTKGACSRSRSRKKPTWGPCSSQTVRFITEV